MSSHPVLTRIRSKVLGLNVLVCINAAPVLLEQHVILSDTQDNKMILTTLKLLKGKQEGEYVLMGLTPHPRIMMSF